MLFTHTDSDGNPLECFVFLFQFSGDIKLDSNVCNFFYSRQTISVFL